MSRSTKTAALKEFTDRVGDTYGTEDFCVLLYAIVKMHAPRTILELGTGLGTCALWMAQAVQENGAGHVYTADDGRDWAAAVTACGASFTDEERKPTIGEYIAYLTARFDVAKELTHIATGMPPFPQLDRPIDLLFSDFRHAPDDILKILGSYLPEMASASSIFVDSASTSFESYALLELLVPHLNHGTVPPELRKYVPEEKLGVCRDFVRESRFDLIHMTESKDRAQNSSAWIKIQPRDLRPYPRTGFH